MLLEFSGVYTRKTHLLRLSRSQHTESVNIIRQITQANLRCCSDNSNRSNDKIASSLSLNTKDMFNPASCFRAGMVSCFFSLCQFFITATFSLYLFTEFTFKLIQIFFRSVCRISPYILAAVFIIKKSFKYLAVMSSGIGNFIFTNQLVLNIYFNMILITEFAFTVLLNPLGISVFLAFFILAPVLRNFAFLDLFVLFPAITLYWRTYDAGINNLSLLSCKTIFTKIFVKLLEQFSGKSSFGKLVF